MLTPPLAILKQSFGYESFRPGQEEIVAALVHGRDVLAVMPTGAGKSLCYQIPALLLPGVTVVVSPLISLMKDQVAALRENGVAAAFLNSSLSEGQQALALRRARQGQYRIVYVAPERLDTPGFLDFARHAAISLVAVDEAHCISHWGQDFRSSYLNICDFIGALAQRPAIAAFTATATGEVKEDIARILQLHAPLALTTGFDRPNLRFEVRQVKPRDKFGELLGFIRENREKSGIVYCGTRKKVEEVCGRLADAGIAATRYHAGMDAAERSENQDAFLYDRKTVMVATNAFGMGIDKSNVGFVAHYNMPKNLESYYQEAGRAGRDGSPADCVLLFSAADVQLCRYFIDQPGDENSALTPEEQEEVRRRDRRRLREMEHYCKSTACLRGQILRYFGEDGMDACGNCGNCEGEWAQLDITGQAQMILSCVQRVKGRFGANLVVEILKGAEHKRIFELKLHELPTYGLLKNLPSDEIRGMVAHLIRAGYIAQSDGQFPTLALTPKARAVLFEGERVAMRKSKNTAKDQPPREPPRAAVNPALLAKLKDLRTQLARRQSVPAYVIFSDAALIDMCARLPKTPEEFLRVSGVGEKKLEQYGAAFLEVIAGFEPASQPVGRPPETPPPAARRAFAPEEFVRQEPLPVGRFLDPINAFLLEQGRAQVAAVALTNRLLREGYLEVRPFEGKGMRVPSEKGGRLGIESVRVDRGDGNAYVQNLYGPQAQRLLARWAAALAGYAPENF